MQTPHQIMVTLAEVTDELAGSTAARAPINITRQMIVGHRRPYWSDSAPPTKLPAIDPNPKSSSKTGTAGAIAPSLPFSWRAVGQLASRGGGAGVRPWRIMLSAIFARA